MVCVCVGGGRRWWWVVVVVQMTQGNGVSVLARSFVQLFGWQNTWEQAPASPPPLPRPNGGGQPWPCTCVHGPEKTRNLSCTTTGM